MAFVANTVTEYSVPFVKRGMVHVSDVVVQSLELRELSTATAV
jgi:hypothetical protein